MVYIILGKGFEEIERFTLREWTSGLFRKVRQ